MRSTFVPLSFFAAALLLTACGKKEPAEPTAQADTSAETDSAPAAPEKKLDYWPLVGPLVAGTYGGECQAMPAMQKVDGAAITVADDGKASAPGYEGNVGRGKQATLSRELRDGAYRATATLAGPEEKVVVMLMAEPAADKNAATIMAGDKQLMCGKSPDLPKLRNQPIYPALAKVLDMSLPSLKCLDMQDMMKRIPSPLKIANGTVTLGKDSWDLRKATLEMVLLGDEASTLSYAFTMPDGQMIQLLLDEAGKLKAVQGRGKDAATHACGTDL